MEQNKYIEIEAGTVQEAIENALKELNCKRGEAEIKVVAEGHRGLFEMGGVTPAKIKARKKI